MNDTAKVEELATAIKGLRSHVARLAKPFRHDPLSGKPPNFNKWSAADWRRNIFANALVRLEQLTANHFDFIETMGVVVVARYIFELSVWLHLLRKDSRYGLVYYRELLDSQRRHFEDKAAHLHREVLLLRECERMDDSATQSLMEEYKTGSWSQIAERIKAATDSVDAKAGRNFSLYLEEAKKKGYGFQAHLVEKKAIPECDRAVKDIVTQIGEFQKFAPKNIQNLARPWRWINAAREAGLEHEHDYVYAFANKVLHATPSSLTTDQKNLSVPEVCICLRYIFVKILEVMELARQQPEFKAGAQA